MCHSIIELIVIIIVIMINNLIFKYVIITIVRNCDKLTTMLVMMIIKIMTITTLREIAYAYSTSYRHRC